MTDGAVTAKGQTDRTPLPCDNCSHAAVCALRPGLVDAVARIDSPKPRLPERLASAITISTLRVTCEHHAPVRPPLTVARLAETGHAPVLPANPAAELVDPEPAATLAIPDAWVDEPRPDRDPYPEGPAPKRHPTPPPQDPVAATKAEYVCTTCGRTFDRRNTWTMHSRTHERGGVQDQMEAALLRDQEVARTVADRVREREGAVDVIAAREADERSHHERARAKAAETWARTHAEQAS